MNSRLIFFGALFCATWAFCPMSAFSQTAMHLDDSAQPAIPAAEEEGEDDGDLGDLDDLLDADISQLSRTEIAPEMLNEAVTTVSRQESTVGKSPAAVYVITNEMIRRSGVRSVPEALRLAPGVEVAKIDANKWAISIRGFNQRFANKLLVQVDGRTVYTPIFAGVFWDLQDVLLEDVDRIEVIRGPGATVWGANAVNGVINIITKSSKDTTGIYAEAGGGDERGFASARVGGNLNSKASWRAYAKWFDRDEAFSSLGLASDDWRAARAGFRTDWNPTCEDTVTLQGDYYDGTSGLYSFHSAPTSPFLVGNPDDIGLVGGNVLFRWTRDLSANQAWALQVYYDRMERMTVSDGFREDRDTVDVDFQHRWKLGEYQKVVWGAGYRNTRDRIRNSFSTRFRTDSRADDTFSTFIQDELTLLSDLLFLTAGSKFSWNDYTGFEYQPTVRMLYTPSNRQSIWASVSRAVRVPSRSDDDVIAVAPPVTAGVFPAFPTVLGDRTTQSEQLLAYEIGMRAAPVDDFFWDATAFYHRYEDLITLSPGLPGVSPVTGLFTLPLTFFNGADAQTYGFELASTAKMTDRWNLRGGYSFLRINVKPGPRAFSGATNDEGNSPRNRVFMHSSFDVADNVEWDVICRYADNLGNGNIPSYFELDTRVAWYPTERCELSLVGRNLLDDSHPEFSSDAFTGVLMTEVERELFGQLSWRY